MTHPTDKTNQESPLIPPHGGYRGLKSFQTATLVYDLTVEFCERYMTYKTNKSYRTYDQMVQAARSGRQNIAEGSQASGTSKKTELKLVGVARASLEELLLDYEDFLRQRELPLWAKGDKRALAVRALARDKSYSTYRSYLAAPEDAANLLVCLIHQANYLLDQQLRSLEASFIREGGFTERLYRARRASLVALMTLAAFAPLGASAAVATITDRPDFQANLTNSLELQSGVGKPTFTRATTAYQTDFEGLMHQAVSGEARFQGARRVQNLITHSQDYTQLNGGDNLANTATATTVTFTGATAYRYIIFGSGSEVSGHIYVGRVTLSSTDKAQVGLGFDGNRTVQINLTATPTVYSYTITGIGGNFGEFGLDNRVALHGDGTTSGTITATNWQVEDVTGQTNQNPSEYVSCGALAAPYHGAGADCVQYFNTLNGNTVASNVVTEAKGGKITSAAAAAAGGVTAGVVDATGPLGYLAEGARTNLALQSEDQSTTWTAVGTAAVSVDQYVAPNGATTMDKVTAGAGSNYHIRRQGSISLTAAAQTYSVYLKYVNNQWASLDINDGADHVATFDLLNGVVGNVTAGVTSTIYPTAQTGIYRAVMTYTTSATASGFVDVVLQNANTASEVTWNAAGTEAVGIWGAQVEAASFASSYIPTTSGSVARNADVLTYPTAGNISNTAGTAYTEVTSAVSGAGAYIISTNTAGGAPMQFVNATTLSIYDFTANRSVATVASVPYTTVNKLATSWNGTVGMGAAQGVLGAGAALDGNLNLDTNFAIGTRPTGGSLSELFGTIRNVQIWKKALSNATLSNLTSTTNAVAKVATKQTTTVNNDPSFQADLANTLDIQRGVGKPTFTRATTAYQTDFEGLLHQAVSGEARFQGARRVQNVLTFTEAFQNAAWIKSGVTVTDKNDVAPDGSLTATTFTGLINNQAYQYLSPADWSGKTVTISIWIKGTPGEKLNIRATAVTIGADLAVTLGTGWKRYSVTGTYSNGNSAYFTIFSSGASAANNISVWHPQVEDVTGQANQNPSEYVSNGVLAAPYHGAGADGVQYFNTLNGNTVSSNVVTEKTGAKITSAQSAAAGGVTAGVVDATGPLGYLAEGARTNYPVNSTEDLTQWTAEANASVSATSIVTPAGTPNADLIVSAGGATSRIYEQSANIPIGPQTFTFSAFVKKGTVDTVVLNPTTSGGVGGGNTIAFTFSTQSLSLGAGLSNGFVQAYPNGWYRVGATFTSATSDNIQTIYLYGGNGFAAAGSTYVWGVQLEIGGFASSYFHSGEGAAKLRAADNLYYTPTGNIATNAGTIYAEINVPSGYTPLNPIFIAATDGGENNVLQMFALASNGTARAYTASGGVLQTNFGTMALPSLGTTFKEATTWNASGYGLYLNGSGETDGAATLPVSFTRLWIGTRVTAGIEAYGTIRNVKIWKKALTNTQLANMTSQTAAVANAAVKKTTINTNQNTKVTSGLVGYWPFNGTDMNGIIAYDRSGQGNNGTTTATIVTEGRVGQALKFNGTSSKISASDAGFPSGTAARTVSMWVKPKVVTGNYLIMFSYGTFAGTQTFGMGINGGTNSKYYVSQNGTDIEGNVAQANTWDHVVAVYDGSNYSLYENGVKTAGPSSMPTNTVLGGTMTIGYQIGATPYYFNGVIDEVRIYNRALTATEVKQLYNLGR